MFILFAPERRAGLRWGGAATRHPVAITPGPRRAAVMAIAVRRG
jgi:hypothetical protein